MSLYSLLGAGLDGALRGPVVRRLAQRQSSRAAEILGEQVGELSHEFREALHKGLSGGLSLLALGTLPSHSQEQLVDRVVGRLELRIDAEAFGAFAEGFERRFLSPYCAATRMEEAEREDFRRDLAITCIGLAQDGQQLLPHDDLEGFSWLDWCEQAEGPLEPLSGWLLERCAASLDAQRREFLSRELLLGAAVTYSLKQQLASIPKLERAREALEKEGFWIEVEELERLEDEMRTRLQEQLEDMLQNRELRRQSWTGLRRDLIEDLRELQSQIDARTELLGQLEELQKPLREARSQWLHWAAPILDLEELLGTWGPLLTTNGDILLQELGQLPLVLDGQPEPFDAALLMQRFAEGTPAQKCGLLKELGSLSGEGIGELFEQALHDPSGDVRASAVAALGERKEEWCLEALQRAIFDADEHIRWSAALAMGNFGDPKAINPLRTALLDEFSHVRWRAIDALVQLEDQGSEPLFIRALHDEHRLPRRAAARALGELGTEESVMALTEAREDSDALVRESAYEALRRVQGRARARQPRQTKARRLADDANRRTQERAKAPREGPATLASTPPPPTSPPPTLEPLALAPKTPAAPTKAWRLDLEDQKARRAEKKHDPKAQAIDAWMQHPTPEFLKHPMFGSLRRWNGLDPDDFGDFPIELTLAAMDAAGVTHGMLSAWWAPEGPLLSNEDVADIIELYPTRFFGVAAVDLYRPMEAIRELRKCVKAYGFKALRVVPWLWRLPPNDRRYYPLYAECVQLDIPFCLQVGHTGPLMPSEPGRPIPYLDDVACDFPELTIVAGHIGFPWTQEMIALATKYPNVYIDTSAYKPKRYPPELIEYMRKHGRKKVLFGSNFPMINPVDCVEQLGFLGLDVEAMQLFLFENAKRVFKI